MQKFRIQLDPDAPCITWVPVSIILHYTFLISTGWIRIAWIRNFCHLDPDPELGNLKAGSGSWSGINSQFYPQGRLHSLGGYGQVTIHTGPRCRLRNQAVTCLRRPGCKEVSEMLFQGDWGTGNCWFILGVGWQLGTGTKQAYNFNLLLGVSGRTHSPQPTKNNRDNVSQDHGIKWLQTIMSRIKIAGRGSFGFSSTNTNFWIQILGSPSLLFSTWNWIRAEDLH